MAPSTGLSPPDFENHHSGGDPTADLAQAFQDLARGEKTAQAMESNLTSLEQKLDELLKSFENSEAAKKLDEQAGAKHEDPGKSSGEVEKGDEESTGESRKS